MAYATIQDLIDRYGQTELVRLTTPADQDLDGIVLPVAEAALADASAEIDGYVGRRYQVPMDIAPPIVVAKVCAIARYKLSTGEQKSPTEEMRRQYDDAIAWARDVSLGKFVLELDEVEPSAESYAQVSTRTAAFGCAGGGWL